MYNIRVYFQHDQRKDRYILAKKRRKKKKELTIEEQLALMNPEEIYEKALKNITVAKVLEDIDLKVVSYNKAM